MKDKKNSVITFRCTETTRNWLEEESEARNWTIAKLVENIISNFVSNKVEQETDNAKGILNYIMENDCRSIAQLTKWAIENNCTADLSKSIHVWEAIIKEKNAE